MTTPTRPSKPKAPRLPKVSLTWLQFRNMLISRPCHSCWQWTNQKGCRPEMCEPWQDVGGAI